MSSPTPLSQGSTNSNAIVQLAGDPSALDEKCVVSQYRTTKKQLDTFNEHMKKNSPDRISVEWVIDIADEANGWFYGTAYHYNDTTQMIHVMVNIYFLLL